MSRKADRLNELIKSAHFKLALNDLYKGNTYKETSKKYDINERMLFRIVNNLKGVLGVTSSHQVFTRLIEKGVVDK